VSFFRPPAVVITTAAQSRREELRRRELRYVLTMSVRVVAFILAVTLFHGVLRWIAVFLALVLPWLAVVIANAPFRAISSTPNPVTPRGPASLPAAHHDERVVDAEWRRSDGDLPADDLPADEPRNN
jgi:hypothetical protein